MLANDVLLTLSVALDEDKGSHCPKRDQGEQASNRYGEMTEAPTGEKLAVFSHITERTVAPLVSAGKETKT